MKLFMRILKFIGLAVIAVVIKSIRKGPYIWIQGFSLIFS